MSLSKRVRFEVFKRDRFTCQYCGAKAPDVPLHADHIEPRSAGGTDELDNLITACGPCNMGKAARPLMAVPKCFGCEEEKAGSFFTVTFDGVVEFFCNDCIRLALDNLHWMQTSPYVDCAGCGERYDLEPGHRFSSADIIGDAWSWICDKCRGYCRPEPTA